MNSLRGLGCSLFFLIALLPCRGQSIPPDSVHFSFDHLTEKDGLNAEFIIYLMKDSRGYLWLCANSGLFRYDGKSFRHYSFSFKDTTSISNNRATHIAEDAEGFLWVSTDQGLNRYDYRTDRFIRYVHDPMDSASLPASQVNRTLVDSKGRIWAGTPNGLSLFEPASNKFKSWSSFDPSQASTRPWIWDLIEDKDDDDILWLGGDRGLYQFRISTQTFNHIIPPEKLTQQAHTITNSLSTALDRVIDDGTGDLWLANRYGKLFKYNKASGQWKAYLISASGGGTFSIFPYDKDHLWLGGIYSGIRIFNKRTETVTLLEHNPQDPTSPPAQVFHTFRDNEGIVWCSGNYQISKFDPFLQSFRYQQLPGDQLIYTAVETPKEIFIGMTGTLGVIGKLTKETGKFALLQIPRAYLRDGRIGISSMILRLEKNEIWMATSNSILVLDLKTEKIKSLDETLRSKPVRPLAQASCILKVSDGSIWIGYRYDGLYEYLPSQNILVNRTQSIQSTVNSPQSLMINDLQEDKNGTLWIATNSGLRLLDKNRQPLSVSKYFNEGQLFNSIILRMAKDKDNNLWLSIKGTGLVEARLDDVKATLGRCFGVVHGMRDDKIEHLLTDARGNLWGTSHNGLIAINLKTNTVKNYDQSDGLNANNLNNHSLFLAQDSSIYLFGVSDYYRFKPDGFPAKNIAPPVYIHSISVLLADSMKTVYPGSLQSLTLKHDENYVSFSFNTLNFSKPHENKYQYRLEGLQEYWVTRNAAENFATYTNLEPGTYTFHVKGSNHDGVWNEKGASFEITILPPPWKSGWAYTGYTLLIAFLAYFLWSRWLTREKIKRLAMIKSAEALQLREMDTIKSNFFANISHEFRTPLTLLLGPIEKRMASASDSGDKKELTIMHRNASRLLTLVNQLLDLSRLEAGKLKLVCQRGDICTAIQSITSQFNSMADSRSIAFRVVADRPIEVYFDRDKLEKIVTNLLSNAFKFTPEGGRITLTVGDNGPDDYFKEGYVKIIVEDNGIGIEAEHLPRVFDRFFQVDMSTTRSYEGSGIGLSLTKELVELHHGKINCQSEKNVGSLFTVQIPLGQSHLKEHEIDTLETGIVMQESTGVHREEVQPDERTSPVLQELPRILVIEDNRDLRYYIRENLHGIFQVLEAADGEAGILKATQEIPDLIISDLMMPKADGLQVCQRLKEDEATCHIPIVLLTAKADVSTKLDGYRRGADDYISKPFEMGELRIRIENLLANRKRIQEKFQKQLVLSPQRVPATSVEERFVKRAMEVVEQCMGDSTFGVENFAEQMAVSHTKLYRKLQALTGFTPNEFVRHMRLQRAADLMRQNAGNVAEITYLVGFNNLSYFSKVFKEKFGITPHEYLKNPPPETPFD